MGHALFTHVPGIVDGYLVIPDRPGWGSEPNGAAIRSMGCGPPGDDTDGGIRIREVSALELDTINRGVISARADLTTEGAD